MISLRTPRTGALLALIALGVTACSDATAPVAPSEASVAAAPLTSKGGPKALPSAGRIYFASDIAGASFDFELYSMNPDGSDRRRLTYSEGYERYPSDLPTRGSNERREITRTRRRENPSREID